MACPYREEFSLARRDDLGDIDGNSSKDNNSDENNNNNNNHGTEVGEG